MMRDREADVKEAEAGCQSTSREEWGFREVPRPGSRGAAVSAIRWSRE